MARRRPTTESAWSTGTCGRHTSCRVARPPSVHVVLTLVVAAEYISRRGRGADNDGVVHCNDAEADDEVRGESNQRRVQGRRDAGAVVH